MHEGQKLVTTKHGILDKLKKKKKEVNSEVKKFTQECNAKKREIQGLFKLPDLKKSSNLQLICV